MLDSILNIEVSCFANYDTPDNPKPVNLLQWLTSPKFANKVNIIRKIEDKENRNRIKATLPAITPSGLFSYRSKRFLIRHSGFIQFDIDQKGNEVIGNYSDLKREICKISNVAYCGLSVSGKGFWGLIPIALTEKHNLYFNFIENWFKARGLIIDPAPKSVSSLRGYAFDSDGYFNHHARTLVNYQLLEQVKLKAKKTAILANYDNVFKDAALWANYKGYPFEKGKHNHIFYLCCFLCYKGIKRSDAETWIYENLLPASEINSNCISYPYENYKADEIKAIEQPAKAKQLFRKPDKTL